MPLSDATVPQHHGPAARVPVATAVREGLIRSNPARDVDLPHRPTAEDSEEEVKAMSREELTTLLALIPERHRLLFRAPGRDGPADQRGDRARSGATWSSMAPRRT